MPFIDTTAPADATGDVLDMYLRQEAAWGFVPNYATVFCHRPEVMARWGRLLAEIKRPMDRRRFELVTFVAALELKNTACALAHGRALRDFFSDGEIAAIAAEHVDRVLDDTEQAIVAFARQVAKDASKVTAGQVDALRSLGVADAEVFDIAATAAGRAFFTKLLDALGVEADSSFLALQPAFRQPLTVGRPVDVRPVKRLRAAIAETA